jgi:isoquinoline 1-oxidoreductase beta subunit
MDGVAQRHPSRGRHETEGNLTMDGRGIESDGLTRRQFVMTATTLAGGLALGIGMQGQAARANAPALSGQHWGSDGHDANEINAWIIIEPDDTVTLRSSHAEMGQGSSTGLAMLIAEELACDWARVRTVFASPNRNVREKVYDQMFTVGSRGIRMTWHLVQQAGASARERLIAAAASRWQVNADGCRAQASRVRHTATGRSLRYGELAASAAKITLAAEPAIKTPQQFTLAGKPLPRLDSTIKVNGQAMFGIDTVRPDMVHAAIYMCPVFGGKLVSVDESLAAGRRGVLQIVKLPNAVAVVADRFWRASEAIKALQPGVRWDDGDAARTDSEQFRQMYRAMLDGPMVVARNDGDARSALASRRDVIEAVYEVPHLAHATMEPLNATVHLQQDRIDIWMGTQVSDVYVGLAAKATGLKPEQVYLHNCYLGGGFGRRDFGDDLLPAIEIAKAVGDRPVKMLWTREDDMRHSRYRPQAAIRFRAALGADKRPAAMHIQIALDSIMLATGGQLNNGVDPMAIEGLASSMVYTKFPHWYCGQALKNTHVPAAYWRSVGGSHNGYFLESFIDELAHAANADPLEFRRSLTDRKDVLGVIATLQANSDWGTPLPKGRGRGIAVVDNHGGVMGMVAEVTVGADDRLRVDRIVGAIDAYNIVNPNLVAAQVEGGAIFGLTAALYGEITIKDGAVTQGNYDDYPMVKMADAPRVETHICSSGGVDAQGRPKWGGVGECTVAPVAAAVTNAIFNATGVRVRRLPLKHHRLSATS